MKTSKRLQPYRSLAVALAVLAALLALFAAPSAQAAARSWLGGSGDWQTGVQGGWDGVWAAGDTGTFNGPSGTVTNKSAITTGNAALGFAAGNYTLQSDDTTERIITLGNTSITNGSGVTTTIGSKVTLTRAGTVTFDGDTKATSTLNINSGGKVATTGSANLITIRETTANVNTGGTIDTDSSIVVGDTADGATLNVQGGTVIAGKVNADANVILGNLNGASTCNLKITGGSLGYATAGNQHGIRVGRLDNTGTTTGIIDLEGGIVTVRRIFEQKADHNSTVNLHGGTLKALINWADFLAVDNIWIKSGGAIFDSNGKAITVTKALAEDTGSTGGGLTLNDTAATKGSLTLTATPTYTGPTIVTAGKLVVPSTHSGGGALTVSANAALGVTVSGTSQWQPASLSLANPCTLEFNDVQNPGTTTAPILPGSPVGTVSGVTINIKSIAGTAAVNDSYPLLGQVSATNGYTLGTQPPGLVGRLAVSSSTLVYVVDSVPDLWTGADGTQPTWWDIGATANWAGKALNNSPVGSYQAGDDVLFDDTATPASPVEVAIQTNVAPGKTDFINSTKDYSVSGSYGIGGSGTLTKTGSGAVTLSSSNSYSGGTTLSGGILTAANNDALGTGALAINPGATRLVVNDDVTLTNDITINGGTGVAGRGLIENSSAGNATLTNGIITINAATAAGGHFASTGGGTLTVASAITATTPIVSQRTGKVIYSGGGTGYTNLASGGTIQVGAANGIATTATVALGEYATPGILDLNGFNQSLVGITKGANSATITNSTTTPATLTLTGSTTTNFAGVIKDDGVGTISLTINGGNVTLSAANSFSGFTTISAGTLVLANDSAVNLTSGLSLAAGATLDTIALTVPPPSTIPLTASGTGITVGTTAAAIIGVSGWPHDLGTRQVTLNFDGANPALYLSGGTLNLNDNPFTINGSVLTNGVYTIIAQSDAPDMTGSVAASTVNGTALTGKIGTVSLSGNTVVLTVSNPTPLTPTIAPVTVSGTNLVVTVPTTSGYNYVLQLATNLTPTINWQNESTNAGDGLDLILNVPIEPGKPQKLLRFWVY